MGKESGLSEGVHFYLDLRHCVQPSQQLRTALLPPGPNPSICICNLILFKRRLVTALDSADVVTPHLTLVHKNLLEWDAHPQLVTGPASARGMLLACRRR